MPPVIDLRTTLLVSREHEASSARSLVNARNYLRRVVDIGLSLLILTVSAPALAMVIVAIRLDSPGPVLFRQKRVGQLGRLFRMYKFRTMMWDPMANGLRDTLPPLYRDDENKSTQDPRVTRVGFHLRRWSIDEIPNLLNVLRGEMALVGPRPTGWAPAFYGDVYPHVISVKPGVTGLWQVMGRGNLTFEERVALDYEYVRNRSLRLDAWILFKTIGAVLSRRGAY